MDIATHDFVGVSGMVSHRGGQDRAYCSRSGRAVYCRSGAGVKYCQDTGGRFHLAGCPSCVIGFPTRPR